MATLVSRFWSKVKKTSGCWLWTAGTKDGYGWFSFRGRPTRAQRVSWILKYGKIPDGLWVLHKCDNPGCVRPSHLFLGNVQDNNRDRHRKGRSIAGENCASAKLSESHAREILNRSYYHGLNRDLAKEFGISTVMISHLRSGRKWKHLHGNQ